MAAPINIGIASNTKAYQLGIENGVIKPTEDAEQQLKNFAKSGDKAGEQLEQALRTAQKESDRTRVDLERMGSEIEQAARQSRSFGGHARQGMGDAGDAVREFGDEARQNLSETVSSFRGDIEDIPQIAQDILGGVVGGLGPIGMAAGAAGAAGIGLIVGKLQEGAEKAEELRQQTNELALEIIEAGGSIEAVDMTGRLREWAFAVRDNKEWWEVWQESTINNLDAVLNAQQYTKRSTEELFEAMSGQNPAAAIDTLAEVEDRLAVVQDELSKLSSHESGAAERERALLAENSALQDVADSIRESQGLRDRSIEQAETYSAIAERLEAQEAANARATEARTDAIDSLQGELDEAIDSWSAYVDAETGATDPAAYLANMQARMNATTNFNKNVQQLATDFGLTADEVQAILDQGVDFAPMLQSIIDSGMGEQYATQIRAMLDGGQAIVDGQPIVAPVTTETDTSDAEAQLDAAAGERTAPIEVKADPKPAERQIDAAAAKRRTATIDVRASTTEAERQLDRLANAHRTATIYADVIERPTRKYDW